jgi:hypothetical protein
MEKSQRIFHLLLALVVLLLACIAVSKPVLLWTDEFISFAFASYESTSLAIRKISGSIAGVNHGQTGFYMFLNHLLLKWFGASYFLLRLPSYVAFVAGITAGIFYLRNSGLSPIAIAFFVVGMGTSSLNLELASDARPYMPLQGAVLGTVWAWHRAASLGKSLGVLFVVGALGILFHPFYPIYLALIVLGGIALFREQRAFVLEHLPKPKKIVFVSLAWLGLFLAVGWFSWFQTFGHKFKMDPFEWIGQSKYPLPLFMLAVFLGPWGKIWLPMALLSALTFWIQKKVSGEMKKKILYLSMLLVITQAILAWVTWSSGYWLLQRQWLGGVALTFLLCSFLIDLSVQALAWRGALLYALGSAMLFFSLAVLGPKLLGQLRNPVRPAMPDAQYAELYRTYGALEDFDLGELGKMQEFARENLVRGGPVNPLFRLYYNHVKVE